MIIRKKNFNNHSFIGNSLKFSSLSMIFGISFKVNSVQRNLTRLDGANNVVTSSNLFIRMIEFGIKLL